MSNMWHINCSAIMWAYWLLKLEKWYRNISFSFDIMHLSTKFYDQNMGNDCGHVFDLIKLWFHHLSRIFTIFCIFHIFCVQNPYKSFVRVLVRKCVVTFSKKHKKCKIFFKNDKMMILLNQKHDRSHYTCFDNKSLSIDSLIWKKNRESHASF